MQFAARMGTGCPEQAVVLPDFGHEGLRGLHDRASEFLCA